MGVGKDKKSVSKLCLHSQHLAFFPSCLFGVRGLLGWKILGWNKRTCFS